MAFSRTVAHATASDATFSAAGAAAWDGTGAHSPAVSGATVGGIAYFPTATSEAMSGMTWQAGGAAGEGLAITAGTAASAVSALSLTQTWNYNSAAIQGVDWTFTDTSSHASTNAFRIRGGAAGTTNLLTLSKDGAVTAGPSTNTTGSFRAAGALATPAFASSVTIGQGLYFPNSATMTYVTGGNNPVIGLNASGSVLGSTYLHGWAADSDVTGARDTALSRISAGVIGVGTGAAASVAGALSLTNITNAGYESLVEMTAPAGVANNARIFAQDNGAGKTQLMVIFGSGVAQQVAIEA